MKKFWEKYKFVFLVFILWRIGLLAIGYWSIGLLSFNASFPYIREVLLPTGLPQWIWHWGNFDGVHYLMISQFGYNGIVNNEQVFFPFFPTLIRVFGGSFISALLLSNLFALISGILIFKNFGKWPLLFYFCFPTAFFLGSIYTEGLFICLLLLSFYKSKLFAIFAGLTRLTGAFCTIFGIIGTGIYMLYLKITFDNPFLFVFHQAGFNNARASSLNTLINPLQTVYRYFKILITADRANIAFWVSLLEISAFIMAAFILVKLLLLKKFNFWILVFCFLTLIVPSTTGTLTSVPRYVLTIFPIYYFLGNIRNIYLRVTILIIFGILQAVLATLFVRGYFIA